MLKVKIDRGKWLRGSDHGALYRNGKMCCLGFACRAAGYSIQAINRRGYPQDIVEIKERLKIKKGLEGLINLDFDFAWASDIGNKLAFTNDYKYVKKSEKYRESQIVKLGKKAGIEFSFVN